MLMKQMSLRRMINSSLEHVLLTRRHPLCSQVGSSPDTTWTQLPPKLVPPTSILTPFLYILGIRFQLEFEQRLLASVETQQQHEVFLIGAQNQLFQIVARQSSLFLFLYVNYSRESL